MSDGPPRTRVVRSEQIVVTQDVDAGAAVRLHRLVRFFRFDLPLNYYQIHHPAIQTLPAWRHIGCEEAERINRARCLMVFAL